MHVSWQNITVRNVCFCCWFLKDHLIISQYFFRQLLEDEKTKSKYDGDRWLSILWCHMSSLGHNELIMNTNLKLYHCKCINSSIIVSSLMNATLRQIVDCLQSDNFVLQTMDILCYFSSLHSGLTLFPVAWWRHEMESFPALLALCAGNSPVTGEFPAQRPVTQSFEGFFDLYPNKRLSKP